MDPDLRKNTVQIRFLRKYAVHLYCTIAQPLDTLLNKKKENSRIEIRVTHEDKELFELASQLQGFKSFSEFLRVVLTKEAKAIIAAEKSFLKSERDKKVFFDALMGKEESPNSALISAIMDFNSKSE
jgi:uncharacterized protein (DUF1778 family)